MTTHAGEDVEQGEHSFTGGGSADLYSYFGNQYDVFLDNWDSNWVS